MTAIDRRGGELVRFALEGLPSMQLADGTFCHEVRRDDPNPRGRSLRYTLMCVVGLARADEAGIEHPFDLGELMAASVAEAERTRLTPGDLGLLLWADTRIGAGEAERTVRTLGNRLARVEDIHALVGMELAWIAMGLAHALRVRKDASDRRLFDRVLNAMVDRQGRSGLVAHTGSRWRGRFPNFATLIYNLLALAFVHRCGLDDRAKPVARVLADRLLELQRGDGGWPWLFDVRSGDVVEPYEIYSVHQDAMAPMALFELSEAVGEPRYGDAALKGLEWIYGINDLGVPMLDLDSGMLYRSIRRRRPLSRVVLCLNTMTAVARAPALAGRKGPLEINPTDRPYHLGWLLETWAGRQRRFSSAS